MNFSKCIYRLKISKKKKNELTRLLTHLNSLLLQFISHSDHITPAAQKKSNVVFPYFAFYSVSCPDLCS